MITSDDEGDDDLNEDPVLKGLSLKDLKLSTAMELRRKRSKIAEYIIYGALKACHLLGKATRS